MVDSTNLPNIDINAIATDLNNKADRDLLNLSTSLFHIDKLFEGNNIARGNVITFNKSPLNYEYLVGRISDTVIWGRAFSSRIKMCGVWAGVDSNTTTGYSQHYMFDCGDMNGNTYTVWSLAWTPTNSITFTQISKYIEIYGVNIV